MTFLTVECTCQPDETYGDGSKPFFYTDQAKAQFMFFKLKVRKDLYRGVHLNGEHIISIKA